MIALALAAALAAAPPHVEWPVEELVVSAHPSPVFWRVTRGAGEVWILGVPEVFAERQRWDTTRLRRLLSGARELLTPPAYTLKGGRTERRKPLPPLSARLPPALARQVGGGYDDLSTVDAAWRLRADLYRAAGLTADEPDRDVIGLAGRRFLPVHAVALYDTPFAESEAVEGARCVEGALADAAFARDHAAAASRAWAVGDLVTVRENTAEPQVAACLDAAPSFAALAERSVADTAAAIETALDRGGQTVTVLTLGALLKRGGALDRLRAAGAQVTAPEAARALVGSR